MLKKLFGRNKFGAAFIFNYWPIQTYNPQINLDRMFNVLFITEKKTMYVHLASINGDEIFKKLFKFNQLQLMASGTLLMC